MEIVIRNREYKLLIIKLIIIGLLFIGLYTYINSCEIAKINDSIVQHNIKMAGVIIKEHPELENKIVELMTQNITEEDYKFGKNIVKKYGYEAGLSAKLNPVINDFTNDIAVKMDILTIVLVLVLFVIVTIDYKRFYMRIRYFTKAVGEIVENKYEMYLSENQEGDFDKLGYGLNQLANIMVNSINKLKGEKVFLKDIISDISHQLKTPLSSLIMLNEILTNGKEMQESVRINFLNKMKIQLDRMEWLVISLLKYARLEAGSIIFAKERFCALESANDAVKFLNEKIKAKNISMSIKKTEESLEFEGDKGWLTEALVNIIKNCIEHSYDNGPIDIEFVANNIFLRIVIRDKGEGISNKDLPYIFKRFRTGTSSIKTESIGIGLSLSKIIIENLGGVIAVKSRLKEGTEFTITFFKANY